MFIKKSKLHQAANGIVDEVTTERLWQRLREQNKDNFLGFNFNLQNISYFLGAIVLIWSMALFLNYGLQSPLGPDGAISRWNSGLILTVTGIYTLLFLLVGRWLWLKYQLRGVCSALVVGAIFSFALMMRYGLEEILGLWTCAPNWPDGINLPLYLFADHYYPGSATYIHTMAGMQPNYMPIMSLNIIAIYLCVIIFALFIIRRIINAPILTLFISISAGAILRHLLVFFSSTDTFNIWQIQQFPKQTQIFSDLDHWLLFIFGALTLFASYILDHRARKNHAFWGYFVGLIYLNSGLLPLLSTTQYGVASAQALMGMLVYSLAWVLFILLGLFLQRKILTIAGFIGVSYTVLILLWDMFKEDTLAFALVIALISIFILGLTYLLAMMLPKKLKLPAKLLKLRPPVR